MSPGRPGQIKRISRWRGEATNRKGRSQRRASREPGCGGRGRCSPPELIVLIDQLLSDFTDAQTAEQLNQRGWHTYEGKPFTAARVVSLRRYHQLKDHGTRLFSRGLLSADEAAKAYGVCRQTLLLWGKAGLLPTYLVDDRGIVAFLPPDEHAPVKNAHKYQKTH